MKNFRKNQGITLIALVITVIVLLILAGVTISTLTGENGNEKLILMRSWKKECWKINVSWQSNFALKYYISYTSSFRKFINIFLSFSEYLLLDITFLEAFSICFLRTSGFALA